MSFALTFAQELNITFHIPQESLNQKYRPPFVFNSHSYRWWKMGFACQQKTKKKTGYHKMRNHYHRQDSIHRSPCFESCGTGTWKDNPCKHLFPTTWSGKWGITLKMSCFGKQKRFILQLDNVVKQTHEKRMIVRMGGSSIPYLVSINVFCFSH